MLNEANRRILNLARKEDGMSRKRYKPEQIINMLREAEVALSGGRTVGEVCRSLGISEQSSVTSCSTVRSSTP